MGIEYKSLSSKEILEVTKDGWDYYINKKSFKKDIRCTRKFKDYVLAILILKLSSIYK